MASTIPAGFRRGSQSSCAGRDPCFPAVFRTFVGVALVLVALQACVDHDPPVAPEEATMGTTSESAERLAAVEPGSRLDTPWRAMNDAELIEAVAAADGRVAVGFKDPEALGGVDDRGRVLASAGAVTEGKAFLRAMGLEFDHEFEPVPAVSLTLPPTLLEQVPTIRSNPQVDYIEPVVTGTRAAQDTTWNIYRVNAPESWAEGTGEGVDLLIIDTGVDKDHSDLDVEVVQGCDGTDGTPDGEPHGTLAAGIAAALDNTIDVIGVAPDVTLWSSRDGPLNPDLDDTACAVEFGRVNDTFVIYMSAAATQGNTLLLDEIAGASDDGLVLVAAVGNDTATSVSYPAAYSQVIGVTATNALNDLWVAANSGPEVELSAPGVSITTTELGGGTTVVSGTSAGAAHVSGAAAILEEAHSSWSNSDVRQALRGSATSLGSATDFGYGLIDIEAALDYSPMDSLDVSITGPTEILPGETCTWFASTNGTSPFTYWWRNDGGAGGTGSGSQFTTEKDAGSNEDHFTIELEVEDYVGVTGSTIITVYEDSMADECVT